MRIKVFIHNGVVDSVLSDGEADVEIIDIDDDYEDRDALEDYEAELRADESLQELDYSTANFEDPQ